MFLYSPELISSCYIILFATACELMHQFDLIVQMHKPLGALVNPWEGVAFYMKVSEWPCLWEQQVQPHSYISLHSFGILNALFPVLPILLK